MTSGQSRSDFPELKKLRPIFARVVGFFFASMVGVTVDLCVFQAAIFAGIPPLYGNIISSGMAIVTTYFFASGYTFNKNLSINRFLLFFAYYAISIGIFSLAIDYGTGVTEWPALLCKILTLPVSFLINFTFSNVILSGK